MLSLIRSGRFALLLPLSLAGCQSPPPSAADAKTAQQTVDSFINTEIATISLAQQELAQAAGVRFDPIMPLAPPAGTRPVPASSLVRTTPSRGGFLLAPVTTHLRQTGTPALSPVHVTQSGNNMPLADALREIVPPGWHIVQSSRLRAGFSKPVNWQGGAPWPQVLDRLSDTYDLNSTIMWASHQVTVDLTAPHPTPQASTLLPPRHPIFSSTTQTGTAVVARPSSITLWQAQTGQTLKDVLFRWAQTASCNGDRHWTVEWGTSVNYRIDAPLVFHGGWRDALNGIFGLYQTASVPLYAGISTPQCILRVDTSPVR